MAENKKRSAPHNANDRADKRPKTKKQWQVPRKNDAAAWTTIEPGDVGIWATCDMNKEALCVTELKDLFHEYAEKLYGDAVKGRLPGRTSSDDNGADADVEELDIEAEIQQEVNDMKKPAEKPLFTNVRIDVQCVLFFKTRAPIEPVSFVTAICSDALACGRKTTRFARRLTPMTLMGKASETGLETVANAVLGPIFHGEENIGKTFAIRPTLRNHGKILSRDLIIKRVADLVGPRHKVDLSNPEHTIVVEVYRNICGMSIVGPDYDRLKRFNLAEIFQPSAQITVASTASDKESVTAGDGAVTLDAETKGGEHIEIGNGGT